jgi:hypothetical protein
MFLLTAAVADPFPGKWVLNVARSHYGRGAKPRTQETLVCETDKEILKCTIKSRYRDGTKVVGSFNAAYDGKPYPVAGIPDIDQVTLQRVDDLVADATFGFKGRPVFGYRAIKSDDGRSLTVVSVEPITRSVLTSVVVYDRQQR